MTDNRKEEVEEVLKISDMTLSNGNGNAKRQDYLGMWKLSTAPAMCLELIPIDWEEYFMGIAFLAAQRSKDPATQVGACIVNDEKKIVGIG